MEQHFVRFTMTDWSQWFQYQLKASADGFTWGFAQIPAALQDQFPVEPDYLGAWQPVRHLWHVAGYERCLALPTMQQWLGAPLPPGDAWHDDDSAWTAEAAENQPVNKSPAALLESFRSVRQEQLDLLPLLSAVDWTTPRGTLWGDRSLSWVVTKTFQHTYEHGDTFLRMSLWWQHILNEIAKAQAKPG
jgi:hypothetical protein